MGIRTAIAPVEGLSEKHVHDMLRIMQTYYYNVSPDQFVKDLEEKYRVILLWESGRIRGFSTQMLFDHDFEGRQVQVIFSGDTIIEKSHWGSLALPVAWGRLMLSILSEHSDRDLYWLLTSKGYKTYRFLPVFFREFYPSCRKEAPAFEKALLCSLARRKFCDRFDSRTWIIRASEGAQCLRPGVADITERWRRDKHIAFFEKANPGHAKGDELVCIARCHEGNLKPFILRRLRP
jgi:hypothetical protein